MVSIQYANAMAETLHYLKGIRNEDIEKIPKKLIDFLKENASKEYICNFDYTKPLKELPLQDETRGIISSICLKYWCTTEEQKSKFMRKLRENEDRYQEKLREKYNPDNVFPDKSINKVNSNIETSDVLALQKTEQSLWDRIKKWFKKLF